MEDKNSFETWKSLRPLCISIIWLGCKYSLRLVQTFQASKVTLATWGDTMFVTNFEIE